MKITGILFFLWLIASEHCFCATGELHIPSPDKSINVMVVVTNEGIFYVVSHDEEPVITKSKLGIIRQDADFSKDFAQITISPVTEVNNSYELLTIKRKNNIYKANQQIMYLRKADGQQMNLIFQVSNDGVAFRYYFPQKSDDVKKITRELTSFHFNLSTKAWMQPMSDAKSGWAKANPSYEEYYQKEIAVGTPSPIKAGWVYPALFKTSSDWALITETFPDGDYCAGRLKAESPDGEYTVAFPQAAEIFPGGVLGPESKLPWYTPWRIIAIGSLKTITESTLGTDLAAPAVKMDQVKVVPGKASWSWVLLKDGATVYDVQKQFIDYAADMHWQYCLIDALWDTQIGYPKIKQLADYAKTKNIGLLLWYNSAGSWNETPQTPKDKMISHESRVKEFTILQQMGIKGVKIDFFGGDGQSMIQYYKDILLDARDFGLLVNFHGTTLPRGLERTYPNLVTMEAIKGMEFATFAQANLDEQPQHCTIIPFTRNVFDPMDYTPMALYNVPKLVRKTTSAFELALPVILQSGITHMAETPEGMSHMPAYVKSFLQQLPNSWDDIRFVDGYPGKLVVLARKAGNKWYIAGLNGENTEKTLDLDLSFLSAYKPAEYITDGDAPALFTDTKLSASKHTSVKIKPNGGFVMVFEN